MSRNLWPLAAIVVVALIGAGCSDGSAENGTKNGSTAGASGSGGTNATDRNSTAQFPQCMRDNGVPQFPDPKGTDQEFVEAIERLGTGSAAFKKAIRACRDVQPPGLLGGKATSEQMTARLKFAQCMRDNGIEDFPDPTKDGPLIDTNRIPSAAGRGARSILGFQAAIEKYRDALSGALGDR